MSRSGHHYGYRLVHVDSYELGSSTRYAAIFAKDGGPATSADHAVNTTTHNEKVAELKQQGFTPKVISVVSHNGKRSYTGLYEKNQTDNWRLKSFLTPDQYQSEYNQNKNAGRKLAYLNAYMHNGSTRFVAIFKSGAPAVKRAKHGLTSNNYQDNGNLLSQKNERHVRLRVIHWIIRPILQLTGLIR